MRNSVLIFATVAFGVGLPSPSAPLDMNKLTPILVVEEIEPCLPFWTEALGFELTATVPHGDKMGFAMLNNGAVELMYQSRASIEADLIPSGAPVGFDTELAGSTTTLFIEVDAIDPLLEAIGDVDVVAPRRQTFYGMDEIFVRAPCGTVVGFAARVEGAEGAPADG